eukprot:scaffold14938_cov130-Isochrysis_galbana.AAC.6
MRCSCARACAAVFAYLERAPLPVHARRHRACMCRGREPPPCAAAAPSLSSSWRLAAHAQVNARAAHSSSSQNITSKLGCPPHARLSTLVSARILGWRERPPPLCNRVGLTPAPRRSRWV